MDNFSGLKYLPIPTVRTSEGGKNMRQFTEDIPLCMTISDRNFPWIYARKLKLKIQRIYRQEIRLSGKPIENFYLKIITDTTIVDTVGDEPPFFVYCILELCEHDQRA